MPKQRSTEKGAREAQPPVTQDELRQKMLEREQQKVQEFDDTGSGSDKKDFQDPEITYEQVEQAYLQGPVGDAALFKAKHLPDAPGSAPKYILNHSTGEVFIWHNSKWQFDQKKRHVVDVAALAEHYVKQGKGCKALSERAAQGKDDESAKKWLKRRDNFYKRALKLRDPTYGAKVFTMATCGPNSCGIDGGEIDRHPDLFRAANTVIELPTAKTIPPSPGLFLMYGSNVEWKGLHAECHAWLQFLDQVTCGDEELKHYLQVMVGYFLTGRTNLHQIFVILGLLGRNGKSVFIGVLRELLGSYFATIQAAMLLEQRFNRSSQGPSPDLMELRARRAIAAIESGRKSRIAEEVWKSMSGGDPVKCRGMHSNQYIEYIPNFKILFAVNRIPAVDGNDRAFRARLRVIPFKAYFTNDQQPDPSRNIYPMDVRLSEKLHTPESLSGILAWAVRGAIEFYKDMEIPAPDIVRQETDQHMNDHDLIGAFVDECLDITNGSGPSERVGGEELHVVFKKWCFLRRNMQERFIQSMTSFGADIKAHPQIDRVGPQARVFYNAIFKPEWQPKYCSTCGKEVTFCRCR